MRWRLLRNRCGTRSQLPMESRPGWSDPTGPESVGVSLDLGGLVDCVVRHHRTSDSHENCGQSPLPSHSREMVDVQRDRRPLSEVYHDCVGHPATSLSSISVAMSCRLSRVLTERNSWENELFAEMWLDGPQSTTSPSISTRRLAIGTLTSIIMSTVDGFYERPNA